MDPRSTIDARVSSSGHEGLTGTAPADLYAVVRERETITTPPDRSSPDDQPAWRQDFPIDWPQDQYVERRDFMKFVVLTSFALTVGQVWIAAQNWLRKRRGLAADPPDRLARRPPDRWFARVPVSGRARQLRPRAPVGTRSRRVQPEVHAPVVCGRPRTREGRAPLPLPRRILRPSIRSANRGTAAPSVAADSARNPWTRGLCDGHRVEDQLT